MSSESAPLNLSSKDPGYGRSVCQRCGTCCKKGGPSLHLEDQGLVETGRIPLSALVTIRKGEFVYNGRTGRVQRTKGEFIRIQGREKTGWTCLYWDEQDHSCGIYPDRPIECRALTCWDTAAIEAIYEAPRLTRVELLQNASSEWIELIRIHEEHCSIDRLVAWLEAAPHADVSQIPSLQEAIAFDMHFRNLTVERSRIHPNLLPFLFGRPLSVVIRQVLAALRHPC